MMFRTPRGTGLQIRESVESNDGIHIVHRLLDFLLSLLKTCKHYIDINIHGSNKLVSYFQVGVHFVMFSYIKQQQNALLSLLSSYFLLDQ